MLDDDFYPLVAYGFYSGSKCAQHTARLPHDVREECAASSLYRVPRCQCCNLFLFDKAKDCKIKNTLFTLTAAGRAAQERRRKENTEKLRRWKQDLESLWRGKVAMENQLGMPLHAKAGLWEFASRCPRSAPAATGTSLAKRHRAK